LKPNLKPSRYPSRASKDTAKIREVLDAGLFCTVAFVREGMAHQIPTGYCYDDQFLYIHGGAKSNFLDVIVGQMVSFSVTLMDGLVLSHSAFDSSFNYRSAIGFAVAEEIVDPIEKKRMFITFTNRYVPGRIADVGDPTDEQVSITRIMKLSLDQCAVKQREGDVNVANLDKYGKWCGVIPIQRKYGNPEIDKQIKGKVKLPNYINDLLN
jgi:nitroimidazol reductase NimA-like FMN-containing flavoprotein (pyridoxamine 5'-phosphate oxidase superfamily)